MSAIAEYRVAHRAQISAQQKKYREANREKILVAARRYHAEHRAERLAYSRRYNAENREKKLAASRLYHEQNAGKLKIKNRAHYEANQETLRAKNRQYYSAHREQIRAQANAFNKANPGKKREQHLRGLYGMTLSDFNKLLSSQGNKCAICRVGNPGKRGWQVDHNHQTKAVRGVLCTNCNTGIGNLRDSVEIISAALQYLRLEAAIGVFGGSGGVTFR